MMFSVRFSYFFSITLLVLLFCVSLSSANLIITPASSDIPIFKGHTIISVINITNNNSFRIFNISFTNISGLSFPMVDSIAPGDTRLVAYSIHSDAVGTTFSVSTISFIYPIEYNWTPKVYNINITNGSFIPNNLTIMQNDSVSWNNFLPGLNASVKDLSSGFNNIFVLVNGTYQSTYYDTAAYTYYSFPEGFTGSLNIINRSNIVYAHDSAWDVPVSFNIRSTLDPSVLQFTNVLPTTFSSNNNQTQYGVVEIKNFDNIPLYNVMLSDDRGWVQWSLNNITLLPLQNLLVNFNVTPLVSRTNDTNTTLPIVLRALSNNGGAGNITISMIVAYQNFDYITNNGINYTINLLNWNATLEACDQHMNEPGFEQCLAFAERWGKNRTQIVELPAQVTVTEAEARAGWQSITNVQDGFQRVENLYNRLYDNVQVYTAIANNNSNAELARDTRQLAYEDKMDRQYNRLYTIMWIVGITIAAYFIIIILSRILELLEEFRLRVATLQE